MKSCMDVRDGMACDVRTKTRCGPLTCGCSSRGTVSIVPRLDGRWNHAWPGSAGGDQTESANRAAMSRTADSRDSQSEIDTLQSHVGEQSSLKKQHEEEYVVRQADGPVPHMLADNQPDADAAGYEPPCLDDRNGPPTAIRSQHHDCPNREHDDQLNWRKAEPESAFANGSDDNWDVCRTGVRVHGCQHNGTGESRLRRCKSSMSGPPSLLTDGIFRTGLRGEAI